MATKSKSTATAKAQAQPQVILYPTRDIPLNLLSLSEANVRTIFTDEEIKDLADDIASRGIVQAFLVRPAADDGKDSGRFEVVDGGRRFRASQLLVKQKRLPADAAIPCVVKPDGMPEDDSLAANTFRADLHPLDELNAFNTLVAKGKSVEDVAATYKVTPTYVKQRMKLAGLNPVLHAAFREEKMNLGRLEAFCVSDDQKRQKQVYEALFNKRGYVDNSPHAIRSALTEKTVRVGDKRVKFIGLKAYQKAGGAALTDLFNPNGGEYLTDPALVNQLVQKKFDGMRQKHLDAGWKWALGTVDINDLDRKGWDQLVPPPHAPEVQEKIAALEAERDRLYEVDTDDDEAEDKRVQERLDAIDAELETLDTDTSFTAEQMASAGVLIYLDWNGKSQVTYGHVLPEDRKAAMAASPAPLGGDEETSPSNGGKKPSGLSMSLVEELTSARTVALRNAMANDFSAAFLGVLHVMALTHFYHRSHLSCLQLQKRDAPALSGEAAKQWAPAELMAKRNAEWKKRLPDDAEQLWDALLAMEDTTRRSLFAHVAGMTINAVQAQFANREAIPHAGQLANAMGMHMVSAGWTPTAANYLGRVAKPLIVDAVREAKGDEELEILSGLKKTEMAAAAERLLQGTGWLPQILRAAPATEAPQVGEDDIPAFLTQGEAEGANAAA